MPREVRPDDLHAAYGPTPTAYQMTGLAFTAITAAACALYQTRRYRRLSRALGIDAWTLFRLDLMAALRAGTRRSRRRRTLRTPTGDRDPR